MRIIISLFIIILIFNFAYGETWKLYFENQLGMKFYIDKDSIHKTPEKTILVWKKMSTINDNGKNIYLEILHEIDCSRRRYKTLQGIKAEEGKTIEPIERRDWEYFEPNDLSTSFFKTVCKK